MRCPKCGTDFNEAFGVCHNCGWIVSEEDANTNKNNIPTTHGVYENSSAPKQVVAPAPEKSGKDGKKLKILIICVVAVLAVVGVVAAVLISGDKDGKKSEPDKTVEEKITSEELYYQFIRDEKTISDTENFPEKVSEGVFSVVLRDFDDDGEDEMIAVSLINNETNNTCVVMDLYNIVDGKVNHCGTSEEYYAYGGGNFQKNICGILDDNIIRIQSDTCNFGGSSIAFTYASYKVEDDKLVLVNDYNTYEFYRYNEYTYEEKVSKKTYSSATELDSAAKDAGFEVDEHAHIGSADSTFDIEKDNPETEECFKGNHIFTLFNTVGILGYDEYGFIHDNTDMLSEIEELPEKETEDEEKNEAKEDDEKADVLEATDEDLDDLCELLYTLEDDYDYESSSALEDAYDIVIMDYGIYSEYFEDGGEYVDGNDPLNKFEYPGYYVYPGENVDWIIENVFNIEPDHSSEYSQGALSRYYHDGNYYVWVGGRGFIRGEFEVESSTLTDDDKYQIRLVADREYEDGYVYIDIIAELKEIDGDRVWSFYELDVSE